MVKIQPQTQESFLIYTGETSFQQQETKILNWKELDKISNWKKDIPPLQIPPVIKFLFRAGVCIKTIVSSYATLAQVLTLRNSCSFLFVKNAADTQI